MIRKLVACFLLVALMLTGCGKKDKEADPAEASATVEAGASADAEATATPTPTPSPTPTPEPTPEPTPTPVPVFAVPAGRSYAAAAEEGISEADEESCIALCSDASIAYQMAMVNKQPIDLAHFVGRQKLVDYLRVNLDGQHAYRKENNAWFKPGIQHTDIMAEKLKTSSTYFVSMTTIVLQGDPEGDHNSFVIAEEFLVRNVGGQLKIYDWIGKSDESIDTLTRGVAARASNPDIWQDEAWTKGRIEKASEAWAQGYRPQY